MAGPRSEPPMPMLTTLRTRRPVWPSQRPERTSSAKARIRPSTSWTPGTTSWPSTSIELPSGARRATWSTARFSVTLIRSPPNMASIRRRSPARSARATSSPIVSPVTRCLDQSRYRSPASQVIVSPRPGSAANSSRRCVSPIAWWCRARACHSGVWSMLVGGSAMALCSSLGTGASRVSRGYKEDDGAAEAPHAGGRRLPAAAPLAGLPGGRGQEVRRGSGRAPGRPAGLLRVLLAVPVAAGGRDRARVRAPGAVRPGPADRRLGGGPVPGGRRRDQRDGQPEPAPGQRAGPGRRAGLALWGGLGVAEAAQAAMNGIWNVPRRRYPNFFPRRLRGLAWLVILGGGLLLAS